LLAGGPEQDFGHVNLLRLARVEHECLGKRLGRDHDFVGAPPSSFERGPGAATRGATFPLRSYFPDISWVDADLMGFGHVVHAPSAGGMLVDIFRRVSCRRASSDGRAAAVAGS